MSISYKAPVELLLLAGNQWGPCSISMRFQLETQIIQVIDKPIESTFCESLTKLFQSFRESLLVQSMPLLSVEEKESISLYNCNYNTIHEYYETWLSAHLFSECFY